MDNDFVGYFDVLLTVLGVMLAVCSLLTCWFVVRSSTRQTKRSSDVVSSAADALKPRS